MDFEAWKTALIKEIETAAEGQVLGDGPQIEKSQKALFDFAEQLRALPPNHAALKALFREETEPSNLMRATVGRRNAAIAMPRRIYWQLSASTTSLSTTAET